MTAIVDLTSAALVTVDLQEGILRRLPGGLGAPVLTNAVRLAEAFAGAGRPVIAVSTDFENPSAAPINAEAEIARPARDVRSGDAALPVALFEKVSHHVSKLRWSAFANSTLSLLLAELSVEKIVLCGLATGIAVESTARSAFERGLKVVVVTDAVADAPARHEHSLTLVLPLLATLRTTETVVAAAHSLVPSRG
ncbi:Nicotinamidase-related amidase [Nakamurella panacisegetis]|uniref:Nicotinamidase-related amidase n=1 Tax=Nakamurella panacisegetis TaxID=1090615 RepID=A0A1H0LCN0_9ACTN|nr:isochorismatase family protein [Nakamurella panacisegetis]SDO65967.1 Nicotinamidase-related amidase [Nakamurella panacisegetis]